jgi:hypothetical protein
MKFEELFEELQKKFSDKIKDLSGQIWEERWPSHPLKSKLFLVLGYENSYVRLLDLETGKRDSVHWTAFLDWSNDKPHVSPTSVLMSTTARPTDALSVQEVTTLLAQGRELQDKLRPRIARMMSLTEDDLQVRSR